MTFSTANLKINLKALVRFHIDLLGFFSKGLTGRSIYSFLLLSYFLRVFNDLATSIMGYLILYLFITGLLLFLAIKIPRTREKMFHMYGKDYIYGRLGNPLKHLKELLVATSLLVGIDEISQIWQGQVNYKMAKEYDKDVRECWREQSHTPTREESEELRKQVTAKKETFKPGMRGVVYDILNISNPNVPRFPSAAEDFPRFQGEQVRDLAPGNVRPEDR